MQTQTQTQTHTHAHTLFTYIFVYKKFQFVKKVSSHFAIDFF